MTTRSDDNDFVIVPTPPEEHAARIANLERELVADAVDALRDLARLNRLAIIEGKPPLGERAGAETAIRTAIKSLQDFYAEHGYQGNHQLTANDVLTRLEGVSAALQPVPPRMTVPRWKIFVSLVAAVRQGAEDDIAAHASNLTAAFRRTTVTWWFERAAAYLVCMEQYGILEKTRV